MAYLKRKLEHLPMSEGDSMDDYLMKVKDLKEELAYVVSTVLQAIPNTYQNVATTIRLMMKGKPNATTFELVSILL